jgi:hypothetical protein
MPFPFTVSTTSQLSFQSHFTSSTHPSLPALTTSQRSVVRAALKSHKRLSANDQSINLAQLISIITAYLRHLCSLDLALSGKAISNEDVDIALTHEIEVEWRPTLTYPSMPGRETERLKGRGLDFEIYFVHHSLALLHGLQARQALAPLYAQITPSPESQLSAVQSASKSFKTAFTLHNYLTSRSSSDPPTFPLNAIDISPTLQSALAILSHAELTLLAILKDDPYPSLIIQSLNPNDKDWMVAAPKIPKVRTQVLRRLCIGASTLASSTNSLLKTIAKVSKQLIEYTSTLTQVCLAKSHRFAALDATMANETGKAVAFLNAGFHVLGKSPPESSSRPSFSRLKDKFSNSHSKPGTSEKFESPFSPSQDPASLNLEIAILTHLHTSLTKELNTINIQLVPDWRSLTATLPSAMVLPVDEKWSFEDMVLSEAEIAGMRGSVDIEAELGDVGGDSSEEETDGLKREIDGVSRRLGGMGVGNGGGRDGKGSNYY